MTRTSARLGRGPVASTTWRTQSRLSRRRVGAAPQLVYHGDDYLWKEPEGGELILQENFTEDDGELTAPEYGDYPVFVSASFPTRPCWSRSPPSMVPTG